MQSISILTADERCERYITAGNVGSLGTYYTNSASQTLNSFFDWYISGHPTQVKQYAVVRSGS